MLSGYKQIYNTLREFCEQIFETYNGGRYPADRANAREKIIEIAQKRFIQENIYDTLINKIESAPPNKNGRKEISTKDDVYETGAIALYMILDNIETMYEMSSSDDALFLSNVFRSVNSFKIVNRPDNVPRKIVIEIGLLTIFSSLE